MSISITIALRSFAVGAREAEAAGVTTITTVTATASAGHESPFGNHHAGTQTASSSSSLVTA
jgi:hypothetical protein